MFGTDYANARKQGKRRIEDLASLPTLISERSTVIQLRDEKAINDWALRRMQRDIDAGPCTLLSFRGVLNHAAVTGSC